MKAHRTEDIGSPQLQDGAAEAGMEIGELAEASFDKDALMKAMKALVSQQLAVVLPDMISKFVDSSLDKTLATRSARSKISWPSCRSAWRRRPKV